MKKFSTILVFLLIAITLVNSLNINNINSNDTDSSTSKSERDASSLSLSQSFELIQDLEASTYFISPENNDGNKDGVFFSFMANQDGNYTLEIQNHPTFVTNTLPTENFISFDNPSGTDLWYIAYSELDSTGGYIKFNFKLVISEDQGKTWETRLINRTIPGGDDIFSLFYFYNGIAFAANPKTGFMIMATWQNNTDLMCSRSFDNGTTWTGLEKICSAADIGADSIFQSNVFYPRIDIGIMKNGSILIVSEADDPASNPIVYIDSPNNGTSWNFPKDVECVSGLNAENPKIQMDHDSGDYWLMWKDNEGISSNDTLQWARFNHTSSLSNNTVYQNVADYDIRKNFDFYYDHANSKFRIIFFEYHSFNDYLKNWTCSSFDDNIWEKSTLGIFNELNNIKIDWELSHMGYVYAEENIVFYLDNIIGTDDIFQFTILQNGTFWRKSADFNQNEFIQIFWNGKKSDMTPIENSLVRVNFICENNSKIQRNLYIFIDNQYPSFSYLKQEKQYFNPQSSNITLTKVPWDLLSSESCDAYLQIFSESSKESSWNQVLENNWDDNDPKIFRSDSGILYVIFKTLEAGRQIIYLTKSYDMGVTWSNPANIFENTSRIDAFHGVAKGDFVSIYIELSDENRLLFRSFDQGNSFQGQINIYNPVLFLPNARQVSNMIITNDNTIFLTYRQDAPLRYVILRSDNLGVNWMFSRVFIGDNDYGAQINPKLTYDPLNNLAYFVMPMDNTSLDFSRIINMSFSVFNFSIGSWSPLYPAGIVSGELVTQKVDFFITRENATATPIVHLVYISDMDFLDLKFYFKEIISDNLGESWSGPFETSLPLYYSDIAFTLDDIFYISVQPDGNDNELFFKRDGRLVRTTQTSVSASFEEEIIFDGIDDFGDYIEEGNYTYFIHLVDYAGNKYSEKGWIYADNCTPQITEFFTDLNIPPIPLNDLIITVNITENTNCTANLYYKKDGASWQGASMSPLGNGYYIGTIPGDTSTQQIQYYIKSTDLAGNVEIYDNNGAYFSYGNPSFAWDSEGLFKESKSYSSSQDYEITIEIESDLEYVDEVIFRYSYDEGDEWEDLELEQNSPEFSGELDDIPGDLRELHYKIIVKDIYGNEHELTDTREVEFYPEVPSVTFEERDVITVVIVSAIVGLVVAIGYIKLKSTSHEMLYKQMFLKDFKKKLEKSEDGAKEKSTKSLTDRFKKQPIDSELISFQDDKATAPFTKVYFTFLLGTISVFLIALLVSVIIPQVGMLLLSASLLMSVFGYMILMSRDISINIYLERIHLKNVALEIFQIFFMFINIVAILLVGYTIDWFRYYLIESTFDIGATSIPRLYISTFAVFFTSLVLVGITTYIQLKKTVKNLQNQRSKGASSNLLLYLKDQNSSRLITRLGYKTIVFLVTVLLSVITTTNLLTEDTGRALIIIILPFVAAGFVSLLVHRYYEKKSKGEKKEQIQLPFSDSKKFCGKCGEQMYLSNKYCGSCGTQQVFEDVLGTYTSRCIECNALINDKSKFCTECGKKI